MWIVPFDEQHRATLKTVIFKNVQMEKIILEHWEIMAEGGSSIWELISDAMKMKMSVWMTKVKKKKTQKASSCCCHASREKST